MPSLRGHMVFVSHLRDALASEMPALGAAVEAHWPAALMGSEGPDGWFFTGQKRPDTHMLDVDDPESWPGAFDRWLESHAELTPGRDQPAEVQAFLAGYISHLGLDIWGEQYQHPNLPRAAREAAPGTWYPPVLQDGSRVRAALRRLGEERFPPERLVSAEALDRVEAPARLNPDAVRRVATGILPSLPLTDPWQINLVNPLRDVPNDEAARAKWETQRASQAPASDTEYAALLDAATDFTLALLRRWWQPA